MAVMKRAGPSALVLLAFLAAGLSPGGTTGGNDSAEAPAFDPFPPGEVLRYRVKLGRLALGSAVMAVKSREELKGRRVVRLELRTESSAFLSRLYRLEAESRVDLATGGSVRFRLEEKKRRREKLEETEVDPGTGEVRSFRRRRSKEGVREERREAKVELPVQDALSLFYHLRSVPLELGEYHRVALLHRHERHALLLAPDGLEEVDCPGAGRFWAFVVHPTSEMPGLFSDKGEATLWVEERTHVLLRMVVESPGKRVELALVGADRSNLLDARAAEKEE
jgi:hypothetical protein